MILNIQKDVMTKALMVASKALPSKTPLEVLHQIRFEATEDSLILIASDSDVTIKHKVVATPETLVIKTPGTALLPGKQLLELVKRFKEGWVSLSLVEGAVLAKSGKSKFTLKAQDVSTYPNVLNDDEESIQTLQVCGNQLMQLFKETLPFTAAAENRPVLTGVSLSITPENWTCVSTDSFRLSKVVVPHDETIEGTGSVIVPRRAVSELIKLFPISKDEQPLQLSVYKGRLTFEVEHLLVSVRLIDGIYPDTSSFIPMTFQQQLQANREELLDLIERVLLLSDAQETVFLTLKPEEGVLNLYASQECGNAEEELNCTGIQHDLRICFNGRFFKEAVQSLTGEQLELSFNGEMRPFTLHEVNQPNSLRLIVPMRIND